jgi:RNA polymerase sigma factor (sigma-70 family)
MDIAEKRQRMEPVEDRDIPTRQSLLLRLKDRDDNVSWKVFFDTYWRLIYRMAKKAGLTDEDADDAVQETVLAVVRLLPGFTYDPSKGSFKGWLFSLTRYRIMLQMRKRAREGRFVTERPGRQSRPGETSTTDRVPDPNGAEIERIWDREWEENLKEAALERVKRQADSKSFQVFDLCLRGHTPADIARTLRITRGEVYLIRHRLTKLLRKKMERLKRDPLR